MEIDSFKTPNQLVKSGSEERTCRICFDVETTDSPLIVPCECSGTMRYIHESCLKTWILSKTRDPHSFQCDVCKTPIKMELNIKLILSCKQLKDEICKIILFPVIILIVSTIIVLIILYLSTSGSNPKVTVSAKIYLSIVMFSCFSVDIAMITILYKAIKIGCFQIEVATWKILSAPQIEGNDMTYVTEIEKKEECRVETKNIKSEREAPNPFVIINYSNDSIENRLRDRLESGITEPEQLTPRLPCEVYENSCA